METYSQCQGTDFMLSIKEVACDEFFSGKPLDTKGQLEDSLQYEVPNVGMTLQYRRLPQWYSSSTYHDKTLEKEM